MPGLWCEILCAAFVVGLFSSQAFGQSGQSVKPYILFVTDVSGSMSDSVSGPGETCSGDTDRISHAKCALQKIVNAYGDINIGLAKFRQTTSDNDCSNGCSMNGACQSPGDDPSSLELLVPIVANNQYDVLDWVNFTCGTCYPNQANDPELRASGMTPLGGSLNGARRYFQGQDPAWMSLPGGDPIRDDPIKDVFVGGAQCRPYIVILLTDGNETCASSSETLAAASSLLSTSVDGRTYRIETKPIGFGMSPCDGDIEAIAHAGGAIDDGNSNTCEGYYAANEDELAVAVSQIIADSLKFESCNGLDDDCDLQIDEDFPLRGTSCDNGLLGVCRGTGSYVCTVDGSGLWCDITSPGQNPTTETCNGLDDDCDGKVDEAPASCSGCTGSEFCDGLDNDCDGLVDENLSRPCGTDVGECTAGTEQCVMGTWVNCSATGPFTEVCDGLDNDCDGSIDGFSRQCTTLPPPGNPNIGICQPGMQTCPSDGSGWGPCLNEVVPEGTDPCDTQDNDCDGAVDEDFASTTCAATCGTGTTVCNMGAIECQGAMMSEPEVCDGSDNDCDGLIDEALPDMGPCDMNGTLCTPGTLLCIGGSYQCIGGQPPDIEICDCDDNDCDGTVDEGTLCGSGQSCVSCQCASPCADTEFPCPLGERCEGGFCLADDCYGVDCPPQNGDQYECVDGSCVRSCDVTACPANQLCRGSDGTCQLDDCRGFPERCNSDEICVAGVCVSDPCADVTCSGQDQYCYQGDCVTSCAGISCPEGQRCQLGECRPHPCGSDCPDGEFCDVTTGQCKYDPCTGSNCPNGLVCNPQNGQCEADPCYGVICPGSNQQCSAGTCDDGVVPDPRTAPQYVGPGGGGGCAIGDTDPPLAMLLLVIAVFAATRRREA